MNYCDSCQSPTDKLLDFFLPMPTSGRDEVYCSQRCTKCILEYVGIEDKDIALFQREKLVQDNLKFTINLLKGRVGQVIIEAILRQCGYEVYPYGYESYFTNIIKDMQKIGGNSTVTQIRATPDLYVYDRVENDGFLLEVKTTRAPINRWWIEEFEFNKYKQNWKNAILTVVHVRTLRIFCKKINEINIVEKEFKNSPFPKGKKFGYIFDLEKEFTECYEYFNLLKEEKFKQIIKHIKKDVIIDLGEKIQINNN